MPIAVLYRFRVGMRVGVRVGVIGVRVTDAKERYQLAKDARCDAVEELHGTQLTLHEGANLVRVRAIGLGLGLELGLGLGLGLVLGLGLGLGKWLG